MNEEKKEDGKGEEKKRVGWSRIAERMIKERANSMPLIESLEKKRKRRKDKRNGNR